MQFLHQIRHLVTMQMAHTSPLTWKLCFGMQELAASPQHAVEDIVRHLAAMAPLSSVSSFVAVRFAAQMCAKDRCVPHAVRNQVLQELRVTALYQVGMGLKQVHQSKKAIPSGHSHPPAGLHLLIRMCSLVLHAAPGTCRHMTAVDMNM